MRAVIAPKPQQDDLAWRTPRERTVARANARAEQALGVVRRSRTATSAQRAAAVASYKAELLRLALPPLIVRTFGKRELCTTQFEMWNSLVHEQPKPFAQLLRPLTRSKDKVIAATAVHYLAWIGLDVDLPIVLKSARSGDALLNGAAFAGGELAVRHGHASSKLKAALVAAATTVATGAQCLGKGSAADMARNAALDCLIFIEPSTAHNLLRSARCIHPLNTAIRQVLWKLYNNRAEGRKLRPPDAQDLWSVYDALKRRSIRIMQPEQARGLILTMTADTDPERTRSEALGIPKPKRGDWSQVAEFAKEALRRCKGIVEPQTALRKLQRNPAAFGRSATAVLRAYELGLDVMGDGLTISLANGAKWREAQRGLGLLGLTKAKLLLEKAARLLEAKRPASESRSASDRCESLAPAMLQKLEPIDEAFFKEADKILAAATWYVGLHQRDFSAAKR